MAFKQGESGEVQREERDWKRGLNEHLHRFLNNKVSGLNTLMGGGGGRIG
jgi:hypothetical protein